MDYFMIDDKAKCFSRKVNKKRINKVLGMISIFVRSYYNTDHLRGSFIISMPSLINQEHVNLY